MAAIPFTRDSSNRSLASRGNFQISAEMIKLIYGILLGGGLCLLWQAIKLHKEKLRRHSRQCPERQHNTQYGYPADKAGFSQPSPESIIRKKSVYADTNSEVSDQPRGLVTDSDVSKSSFNQNIDKWDPRCGEKRGVQWWHNSPPKNWPKITRFSDYAIEGIASCSRKLSLKEYIPISAGGPAQRGADRRGTWINEMIGPFDQNRSSRNSSNASPSSSPSSSSADDESEASEEEDEDDDDDDDEEIEAQRRQPIPVDEHGRRGKKSVVPTELMKSSFWKDRLAQQETEDECNGA